MIFAHFSFLIPAEKLIETASLLAFHHPHPAYGLHILIVPKAYYPSPADLPTDDQQFERDLFQAVQALIKKFDLLSSGYRLILNGGKYQEVTHLHFHLISEVSPEKE